ncbi:Origin recognition complex, subunit 1 [Blastocladiella emersonii ATCC 22665]|nr:Origin recognition complex, subunit 1 [Blastocladiella emersonii ATCC 22665]
MGPTRTRRGRTASADPEPAVESGSESSSSSSSSEEDTPPRRSARVQKLAAAAAAASAPATPTRKRKATPAKRKRTASPEPEPESEDEPVAAPRKRGRPPSKSATPASKKATPAAKKAAPAAKKATPAAKRAAPAKKAAAAPAEKAAPAKKKKAAPAKRAAPAARTKAVVVVPARGSSTSGRASRAAARAAAAEEPEEDGEAEEVVESGPEASGSEEEEDGSDGEAQPGASAEPSDDDEEDEDAMDEDASDEDDDEEEADDDDDEDSGEEYGRTRTRRALPRKRGALQAFRRSPNKSRVRTTSPLRGATKRSAATPSTPSGKRRKVMAATEGQGIVPALRRKPPAPANVTTYVQAKTALHVSTVPESLPCRENEFGELYAHLDNALREQVGTCLYVSGVPGTGKTATFFEALRTLQEVVDIGDLPKFNFVEVNGMKVLDPAQAYGALWQGIAQERVTDAHAQELLTRYYTDPHAALVSTETSAADRRCTVLLLDELDLLVTKRQGVMYNLFDWAQLPSSRLVVVAIANTMDLPERMLTKRVASRLGLIRVDFAPYSEAQLVHILHARLGESGAVVSDNAMTFAARKVATVNGDARRLLDVCRRAVELAETEAATKAGSAVTGAEVPVTVVVQVPHIKAATDEMYASPVAHYLRTGASYLQKLVVAVLVAAQRRTGLREIDVDDVMGVAREAAVLAGKPLPDAGDFVVPRTLAALASLGAVLYDPRGGVAQLNSSEQDAVHALKKDAALYKLATRDR